jgi:hypothetical protein
MEETLAPIADERSQLSPLLLVCHARHDILVEAGQGQPMAGAGVFDGPAPARQAHDVPEKTVVKHA